MVTLDLMHVDDPRVMQSLQSAVADYIEHLQVAPRERETGYQ
jgi:hypothetical protein